MIEHIKHHSLHGRRALVVGCGPSLDAISDADLKRLGDSDLVKVGLNFAPLSEKIVRNNFKFDMVVFREDCMGSKAHACLSDMATKNEFLFVRIGNQADEGKYHQKFAAEYFPQSCGVAGNVVGLCMYAGIKNISFLGVDLAGGYCQWDHAHDDLIEAKKNYEYNSNELVFSWKMMLGKIDPSFYGCLSATSLLLNVGIPLKTVDDVLAIKG